MPQVEVNIFAVIVATVWTMVLGSLWYSKALFGNIWMEDSKVEMKKAGAVKAYLLTAVGAFVLAYVTALFIGLLNVTTIQGGVQTGFWIWLGFVATTSLVHHVFEGKPIRLYILNAGYHLVELLVMGAILSAWR